MLDGVWPPPGPAGCRGRSVGLPELSRSAGMPGNSACIVRGRGQGGRFAELCAVQMLSGQQGFQRSNMSISFSPNIAPKPGGKPRVREQGAKQFSNADDPISTRNLNRLSYLPHRSTPRSAAPFQVADYRSQDEQAGHPLLPSPRQGRGGLSPLGCGCLAPGRTHLTLGPPHSCCRLPSWPCPL